MKAARAEISAPSLLRAPCYCPRHKVAGCCVTCAAWRALFRRLHLTHRMVCAWRSAGGGRHA